jgi:pimeloyl-ACP methyl ester carboxylesterase
MDPRDEFERAEARLYAGLGSERRESWVTIEAPTPLRVRYVETGAGRPVLFVHGGGAHGAAFAPLLPHLPGILAIIVDRPGFGLSEGLGHRRTDLRRHAVTVLEHVLDAAGIERAALVGNSMGGTWAAWLALDRPERVASLALLGCPALVLETSGPFALRAMGLPALGPRLVRAAGQDRKGLFRTMERMNESRATMERQPDGFVELAVAAGSQPAFAENWSGLLWNAFGLRGRRWHLGEHDLRAIRQPVLLAWGERDPFGGLDVARRVADLTSGRFVEVPTGGHLPWLDDPALVGRAIAEHVGGFTSEPAVESVHPLPLASVGT